MAKPEPTLIQLCKEDLAAAINSDPACGLGVPPGAYVV